MSTVAKDMGAAPGLVHLWWMHGWFILLVYCFSAGSCTPLRPRPWPHPDIFTSSL